MKKLLFFIFFVFALSPRSFSQLPNGSVAPDFTLVDLNGISHNIYTYLDQGKAVFIEFFACHCPSCWSYHNTNRLKDLYNTYGPNGTDQVMVLMLEHDEYNGDAFYGQGGYTAGDWTANNPIPMFDVEGADRIVFDDYDMPYYPFVYLVCPDKTTKIMSTSLTHTELFAEADACAGELSVESIKESNEFIVYQLNNNMIVDGLAPIKALTLVNQFGQIQASSNDFAIDVSNVSEGIYFLMIETEGNQMSRKVYIQK